jgi:hypothetical protein
MLTFSKFRAWCNPAGALLILAAIFIGAALAKAGGSRVSDEPVKEHAAAADCCEVEANAKPQAAVAEAAASCPNAKGGAFVVASDLKLADNSKCSDSKYTDSKYTDSNCTPSVCSKQSAGSSAPIACDNECAEFIAPIVNLWAARHDVAVDSPEAKEFANSLVTIHSNQSEDRPQRTPTGCSDPVAHFRPAHDAPGSDCPGDALAARCAVAPSMAPTMYQPCVDLDVGTPGPPPAVSQVDQLRAASAEMDQTAMSLERGGLYEAADRVRASAQSLRIDSRGMTVGGQEATKQHATSTNHTVCDAASCGECCEDADGCCKDSPTVVASDCLQEMIAEWTRMFGGGLKSDAPPAKCDIEPRTAKSAEGINRSGEFNR